MRRFGQIIRQTGHFGKQTVLLNSDRPIACRLTKLEEELPATAKLGPIKKGKRSMSDEHKALRSGGAAIVFFTAISSVTAIAAAVLPFIITN
jgi:hypothetical protein